MYFECRLGKNQVFSYKTIQPMICIIYNFFFSNTHKDTFFFCFSKDFNIFVKLNIKKKSFIYKP